MDGWWCCLSPSLKSDADKGECGSDTVSISMHMPLKYTKFLRCNTTDSVKSLQYDSFLCFLSIAVFLAIILDYSMLVHIPTYYIPRLVYVPEGLAAAEPRISSRSSSCLLETYMSPTLTPKNHSPNNLNVSLHNSS